MRTKSARVEAVAGSEDDVQPISVPPIEVQPIIVPDIRDEPLATGTSPPGTPSDAFPSRGAQAKTPEMVAQRRLEDRNIIDWLGTMSGIGPIQIRLRRIKPKFLNGRKTDGHLDTFDEFISEEDIRDRFGGGTYVMTVMKRNPQGSWVFHTSLNVEIAGEPRLDQLPGAEAIAAPGVAAAAAATRVAEMHERSESSAVDRMTSIMEKQLEKAESRGSGNIEQMRLFMRPLEIQLESTARALEAANVALREQGKTPVNPHQDKLLDKLIDQDTARVAAITAQFQSEIRTIKESAREDEKRLRDQFQRDTDRMERQHERELANLKMANEMTANASKLAHETNKSVLDSEIRRTERELTEMRAELKTLRERKDQSLLEKAKELQAVREALGDDDDDEKEKGTLEKVVDIAVNSDKLMALAGRFMAPQDPAAAAAAAAAARPQIQAAAQPGKPRVMRNRQGETFVIAADGTRVPVQPRRIAVAAQQAAAGIPQVDPQQAEGARIYLEIAFVNKQDPSVVATSIRSAIPDGIMQAIRDTSVDEFLNKVAKLPGSSPLSTQAGRNWTRALGKALVAE